MRAISILLRQLRAMVIGLTICYALVITCLALAWSAGIQGSWILALSNIFALYFFLPTLPLLLLGVWLRSHTFWLALAVPLTLFALLFGSHLLPPRAQAAAPTVRLLTMNVLYRNERYNDVVSFVRKEQPDIVMVQELEPEMAAVLDEGLADLYPHRQLPEKDQRVSLGVFSRYPIVTAHPTDDPRLQDLTIDVDGRQVRLINAHPRAPKIKTQRVLGLRVPITFLPQDREKGLERLVARIDQISGPLVVAGDLNLTDREASYRELSARVDNAFESAGWGFGNTFPSQNAGGHWAPFPLVRIDHVWSSKELPAQQIEVRCNLPGSDHCALLVDLGLTAER